jgi:hypothetical protein
MIVGNEKGEKMEAQLLREEGRRLPRKVAQDLWA